jgi:hypothetical protein
MSHKEHFYKQLANYNNYLSSERDAAPNKYGRDVSIPSTEEIARREAIFEEYRLAQAAHRAVEDRKNAAKKTAAKAANVAAAAVKKRKAAVIAELKGTVAAGSHEEDAAFEWLRDCFSV